MKAVTMKHKQLAPLRVIYKSDGSLGIDNVKEIMTIVVTFFVDLIAVLKDRNWFRLFDVILNLLKFGNIVTLAKEAWDEFKDMSPDESRAVVDHFKEIFDIENDHLEALIEHAFEVIPRIYDLVLDAWGIGVRGIEIFNELKDIFVKDEKVQELGQALAA